MTGGRVAGLRYVDDSMPGIRRVRRGRGFAYIAADGTPVTDAAVLRRIRDIAIPPAWTDVWIAPSENGHIQATGRDARRRKQYRYHTRWRETRDAEKYERVVAFAESLPTIRRRVDADMRRRGLPLERVVATVVRLLDSAWLRVGNSEYARENDSFGVTTLRDEHVDVGSTTVHLRFRGKGGKEVTADVDDPRVARVVRRLEELPGQELFRFLDDAGESHVVRSEHVNEWLRETTERDFTAKDFRTWAGTVAAVEALRDLAEAEPPTPPRRSLAAAVRTVAQQLGNTPAVCRRCYIHPSVVAGHLDGTLKADLEKATSAERRPVRALSAQESAVLAFLRLRLRKPATRRRTVAARRGEPARSAVA